MTSINRHEVTLSHLTPTQREVLAGLVTRPLWRSRNGWRRQGDFNRVSLATGNRLLNLGLAEDAAGKLRLTGHGRALAGELYGQFSKRKARR